MSKREGEGSESSRGDPAHRRPHGQFGKRGKEEEEEEKEKDKEEGADQQQDAKRARCEKRQEKTQRATASFNRRKENALQQFGPEGLAQWLEAEAQRVMTKYSRKKDKKVQQMPESQAQDSQASDSDSWPSTESLGELSPTIFAPAVDEEA